MIIDKSAKGLGNRIAARMAAIAIPLSSNATTVGGLTDVQIATATTKAQIGLGSVDNFPLRKVSTDVTALATEFATPNGVRTWLLNYLASFFVVAGDGKVAFYKAGVARAALSVENFIADDVGITNLPADLTAAQASKLQRYVYDLSNQQLWDVAGASPVLLAGSLIPTYIKSGRWYCNRTTKKLFYVEALTSIVAF